MISVEEYRQNKARIARYGYETNLQEWWHDLLSSLTRRLGTGRELSGSVVTPAIVSAVIVVLREWRDDRSAAYVAIVCAVLILGGSVIVLSLVALPISLLIGTVRPIKSAEGSARSRQLWELANSGVTFALVGVVGYLLYQSFI